ncbi:AcrR family transcriptional regulator [Clavibacter michiganensis]|uniref:TetR/AcrR family transcriptional regulator n=1 Tax=Clavibacter michiganensis TaxID=28447 RepID=UPI001956F6F9|nr:TetR/AcrR family transcriptional regulator [Clavibacter michiganensis]MBM7412889.1 AcrR family transcriptional regulator [Clavibacter michiganensis]
MRDGMLNARGVRRRAEIIAAARSAFAADGYRGSTMAAIATRAGVTHAGLLYHFATKEDLLEAVLADESGRQTELLSAAEVTGTDGDGTGAGSDEAGGDALDRLRALVRRNESEPEWARLFSTLLGESVAPDHPVRARMAERYDSVGRHLAAMLDGIDGRASGLPAGEAESLARLLLAVMDGLQYQSLTGSAVDVEREFATMVALVRARLDGGGPALS